MLFSHTCRSTHKILGTKSTNVCHKNHAHYTRWQHISYLSLLSRDLPDYWVCEACITLHIVDEQDVPSVPGKFTCPLGLSHWKALVYNERTRVDCRFLALEHRHVQLALKYMRMKDPKYDAYLQALLKPYYVSRFPPYMNEFWSQQYSAFSSLYEASYSAHPKIVSDPDGKLRFLLLSTWVYKADPNVAISCMAISRMAMGELAICPHCQFRSGRNFYYIRGKEPALEDALGSALLMVHKYQCGGMEMPTGSCPRCPTDFALQATTHSVEIQAWQDMGTEGSPRDLSWRIHTMGLSARENRDCLDASVPHTPGSIRERFNAAQDPKPRQLCVWGHITDQIYEF
ncbi:hypothetical protein F4813DRAFT_360131 [Daldinia decipiens]|uniref:uncharacterized protein n=1 Tax=Daldinia decipiens TaxID=326647 RepID=UPI0020C392B9|nr:uncharacterized protein F4813DRAFT_360131 [Daldinia decipiens]KAI1657472.1 hypothetical protein F4813DRAFT_360131 [Daldinia decipiens]